MTRFSLTEMPRKKSKRAATPKGDCYEAAGKFILNLSLLHMDDEGEVAGSEAKAEGLVLVHAEVRGQGPMEGVNFGHAFVVEQVAGIEVVIDKSNGRDIRLPKPFYYMIGGIEDIGNYHEYTPTEMFRNMLKYRHWGPWDLKTSSGL